MHLVHIPTLHDYDDDFRYLFGTWDSVRKRTDDVYLNFSQCRFLKNNAVAFIGGMKAELALAGRRMEFNALEMDPNVREILTANGFLASFGYLQTHHDNDSIPYRHDKCADGEAILNYLTREWLKEDWLYFDDDLRYAIGGQLWEVYANAFEHSAARTGVFTCGGHFPRSHTIGLTVVDFGKSITANVRSFLMSHGLDDVPTGAQCMRWAFQEGTSTSDLLIGRGLGLSLLKTFVRKNRGCMQVFSGDGYARVDEHADKYRRMKVPFPGTLVNILLEEEPFRVRLSELS